MKILVLGGAGYIGSHTVVDLLENNYDVVIIDNFSNSKPKVLENIKKITNKDFKFYEGDVQDKKLLEKIFTENKIIMEVIKNIGEVLIYVALWILGLYVWGQIRKKSTRF